MKVEGRVVSTGGVKVDPTGGGPTGEVKVEGRVVSTGGVKVDPTGGGRVVSTGGRRVVQRAVEG